MTNSTNYELDDGVVTLPDDTGYLERLLALPNLGRLWVPDASLMTFSGGKIASVRDLTDSEDLDISPSTIAPAFDPAGFGALPSIKMSSGKRLEGDDSASAEDAFTMFWIGKWSASLAASSVGCSVRTDSANQVYIAINATDNLRFSTGGSFTDWGVVTLGDVYAVIGSVSGTTRKMWVNGVRQADGVMIAGAGAADQFTVGCLEAGSSPGSMDGHIGVTGYFTADMIADPDFLEIFSGLAEDFGAIL